MYAVDSMQKVCLIFVYVFTVIFAIYLAGQNASVQAFEICGSGFPPANACTDPTTELCVDQSTRANYCSPDGVNCAGTGAACDVDGLCSNGCSGQVRYWNCVLIGTCGGPPAASPTPTTPVCPIPAPPGSLNPDGWTFNTPGQFALSWPQVSGATNYRVRLFDEANPACDIGAITLCPPFAPAGCTANIDYFCDDAVFLTTITSPQLLTAHKYSWWVLSDNSCGISPPSLRARIEVGLPPSGTPTPFPIITQAYTIGLQILPIEIGDSGSTNPPLGKSLFLPACGPDPILTNWEDEPCLAQYPTTDPLFYYVPITSWFSLIAPF